MPRVQRCCSTAATNLPLATFVAENCKFASELWNKIFNHPTKTTLEPLFLHLIWWSRIFKSLYLVLGVLSIDAQNYDHVR